MKKILFPTDFSNAADHAFIYALQLAKQLGASITTLHCYELPTIKSNHLPVTTRSIYEDIRLDEFEDYKDNVPHLRAIAVQAGMEDIPVNHVMQEGEAIYNIVRLAKKEQADLIVMGTTGASGLKRIFLGSTASEVMERAACPVLAVPAKSNFDGLIDKVAFATEYKEEETKALQWLANWSVLKDAAIHCFHVDLWHIEDLANKMVKFKKPFEGQDNLLFEVVDHNNLDEAFVEFLEEKKVDVLAMVIHKRNFLREFFSFSTTKSLSYHLTTPILAISETALEVLSEQGKVVVNATVPA